MGITNYHVKIGDKYYTRSQHKKWIKYCQDLANSYVANKGKKKSGQTPVEQVSQEDCNGFRVETRLFYRVYKNYSLYVRADNTLWLETIPKMDSKTTIKTPVRLIQLGYFCRVGQQSYYRQKIGTDAISLMARLNSSYSELETRISRIQNKIWDELQDLDISLHILPDVTLRGELKATTRNHTVKENSGVAPQATERKNLMKKVKVG